MRLMQLLEEAGSEVEFIDPHVPEIPPMREYGQFRAKSTTTLDEAADRPFDIALIATDHDDVDYAALLGLGIPVVDTRNAIAARGLPGDLVTKA